MPAPTRSSYLDRPKRNFFLRVSTAPLIALHYTFVYLPKSAWWSFRKAGLLMQCVTVFLILASIGVSATIGYRFYKGRQKGPVPRIVVLNQQVEKAASLLDDAAMREALEELHSLAPADIRHVHRLATLDSLDADPEDSIMVVYALNKNLLLKNHEAAAREAKKRIISARSDWYARCVLAHDALRRGKPAEAEEHLKVLPSPFTANPPVGPGGLSYALQLFRFCKLDDEPLRRFRATKMLPVMRMSAVQQADPRECVQLFELYLAGFEDIDTYKDWPTLLVPCNKMIQYVIDHPKSDASVLSSLGQMSHRLLNLIERLRPMNVISEEQTVALIAETQDRITACWTKLLAMDEKAAVAYVGMASLMARQGKWDKANEYLSAGTRKCGLTEELLMVRSQLLYREDPQSAVADLVRVAANSPNAPIVQLMLANTARRAGDNGKALQACREVLKTTPDHIGARLLEARILLEANRTTSAAESLAVACPGGDLTRVHETTRPEVAELYVRYLMLCRADAQIPAFIEKLSEASASTPVLVAAGQMALEAGYPEVVSKVVTEPAAKNGDDSELQMLAGNALLLSAEPTEANPTKWNSEQVRLASLSYQRVIQKNANDLPAIERLAWLQAKASDNRPLADRTAVPLKEQYAAGTLPSWADATLGTVHVESGRYDEGFQVLRKVHERNVKKATADPGVVIEMAVALLKTARPDEARNYLTQASQMTLRPRERAELLQAQRLLEGKKP